MEGEIVDIEFITVIKMLYGRRDRRYRTYHFNNIIIRCLYGRRDSIGIDHYINIIIRCCMEGEIADIELITIISLL